MPAESRELTDTVVAVTGASSGIGAATAQLLLDAGAKAAIQARRRDRLDALANKYGADNVFVVTRDVQNPDSATELVRPLTASGGWTASSSTPASACMAASSTAAITTCRP